MARQDPHNKGRLLAWLSGLMAVVFFLSINIWANRSLTDWRIDLTEDRLFTVSEGTKSVLASIKEPIRLRLFMSKDIDLLGSLFQVHSRRVNELLDEYQRLSGGLLLVDRIDPKAFSPEEDQAVSEGLRGVALSEAEQLYFGLVGNNSTDDREVIRFFSPDRTNFLEYDLTKLISSLNNPEKPKLALLGAVNIRGSQADGYRAWRILDHIGEFFQVQTLRGAIDEVPEDVEILMLTQPQALAPQTLYAIDQFVLRGGRLMAFLDPNPEVMRNPNPAAPPPRMTAARELAPLLKEWGVEVPNDTIVGDRANAAKVQIERDGRVVLTDYVAWVGAKGLSLSPADVITSNLQQVNFKSPGSVRPIEGASTDFAPLIITSPDAQEIDATVVREQPDPLALLNAFEASGQPFVLAARVSGPIKTAYPEGPPAEVTDQTIRDAHQDASQQPANVIVVADVDLLHNSNWVREQSMMGQRFFVTAASNGDFVTNALDNLSGDANLIGLRGKGLRLRAFDVIEAMQRDAEDRFRSKEEELRGKIDAMRERIRALQEEEQQGGIILTAEQQRSIEDSRAEMLDLRAELREVQFALRKDVDALGLRLQLLNIWTVPALIGLFAIALAFWRRRQAARSRLAGKEDSP